MAGSATLSWAARVARLAVVCLLVAAGPLQALAQAGMARCGPAHASHAAHGVEVDASAAAATPHAGHGDHGDPADGAGTPTCSHCAACFPAAAPPALPALTVGDANLGLFDRAGSTSAPSFLTTGPDRPPRAPLA